MIPYLRERYGIQGESRLRVLKVVGLGESRTGELIADFMEKGRNPTVGTLAHLGRWACGSRPRAPTPKTPCG